MKSMFQKQKALSNLRNTSTSYAELDYTLVIAQSLLGISI